MPSQEKIKEFAMAILFFVGVVALVLWMRYREPQAQIPSRPATVTTTTGPVRDRPLIVDLKLATKNTPTFTLSQTEVTSEPLKTGPYDGVVMKFVAQATGESMMLRIPALVLRKTGGAPWRTMDQARFCVSDIRVLDDSGKDITEPIYEVIEGPELGQGKLIDPNTIVCRFRQANPFVCPADKPQSLTIVVRIGGGADITMISAALEAGYGNVIGAISSSAMSSGTVVGPVRIITTRR